VGLTGEEVGADWGIGVIGARRRRPSVGEDGNGSGMDERGVGVVKWSGVEWRIRRTGSHSINEQ